MAAQARPWSLWPIQARRVLDLVDNQVRSLRKRQLIDSYCSGLRGGAYWGIRTDIRNYQLPTALPCPAALTLALANVPTRLRALDPTTQERLINWGYAVCDAALRTHVDPALPVPPGFPFPGGVG